MSLGSFSVVWFGGNESVSSKSSLAEVVVGAGCEPWMLLPIMYKTCASVAGLRFVCCHDPLRGIARDT